MSPPDPVIEKLAAPSTRIVVVGGGVPGLIAARECGVAGFTVTLVDAGDAPARDVAGVRIDAAPPGFALGEQVDALVRGLGIADRIVAPEASDLWVGGARRTAPLPRGGLLGIPSSPRWRR